MRHWKIALAVILLMLSGLLYFWPVPEPEEPDLTEEEFVQQLAESHVQGNVPEAKDFQPFLTRDLRNYFMGLRDKSEVKSFEMLRDRPTQVGLSFPKFYVWAELSDGREAVIEVAAVNKQKFEIAQIFFADEIRKNKKVMDDQLPPPVVEIALQKAH